MTASSAERTRTHPVTGRRGRLWPCRVYTVRWVALAALNAQPLQHSLCSFLDNAAHANAAMAEQCVAGGASILTKAGGGFRGRSADPVPLVGDRKTTPRLSYAGASLAIVGQPHLTGASMLAAGADRHRVSASSMDARQPVSRGNPTGTPKQFCGTQIQLIV